MYDIEFPDGLAEEHYENIKGSIKKKLDKIKKKSSLNLEFKKLIEWLSQEENLKTVICSKPEELLKIYRRWRDDYLMMDSGVILLEKDGFTIKENSQQERYGKEILKDIQYIFDYNILSRGTSKWDAYRFCERLKVKICPYCNRGFIYTIEKGCVKGKGSRLIRAELDHYFSQKRYPMFALSAYNLIPSCHFCNSNIKHDKELDIKKYFHPYIDEEKEFSFYYRALGLTKTQIKMKYHGNVKAKNTCDFFELENIYRYHNDISDKAEEKSQEFNDEYVEDIKKVLNCAGIVVSKEKLLHIIYDSYIIEKPNDEILGKLKDDIFKQIRLKYR